MSSSQSTTSDASDSESDVSTSSSSYSGSSQQSSQQQSQSTQLEEAATLVCTKWTPKSLVKNFKDKYDLLSEISTDILSIIFDGMKEGEEKSIWLRNDAFKALLRAWPKWSKWIPIDNCGLHKKFKMNTGVLYFLLKGIESIQSNPQKLKELNERINEKTEYERLEDMLDFGMCSFLFSFSLCLFSTRIFYCSTIFFCNINR